MKNKKIMKNKFAIIALSASLLSSFSAQAQETGKDGNENFAAHKSEIISNLNREKSIIDVEISCINAASKTTDAKACHDQKRASMDALRKERDAARDKHMLERKGKLQDKINKIDERKTKKDEIKSAQ